MEILDESAIREFLHANRNYFTSLESAVHLGQYYATHSNSNSQSLIVLNLAEWWSNSVASQVLRYTSKSNKRILKNLSINREDNGSESIDKHVRKLLDKLLDPHQLEKCCSIAMASAIDGYLIASYLAFVSCALLTLIAD